MSTSNTPTPTCPLCNQPAEKGTTTPEWVTQFKCKRCGRFDLQLDGLAGIKLELRYLLSAAIRNRTGAEVVTISQANVETLMQQAPKLGVSETLNQILELAAQRTEGIGSFSTLDLMTDYPLVAAHNSAEMYNLVGALKARGLLIQQGNLVSLTVQGWERLEDIRRSGRSSSLVFVAMYFHESTKALYEDGIKPAVREAGYEPLRIDQHEHVNRIDDEIIGQVRRSRFMVADFTGQRHGVYFEAGFMMGLARNVIWMCDKSELPKLHFDVRQYSFIDWESVDDARIRLLRRIRSLEGEGPNIK